MTRRYLVTGSAGFIGSHLTRSLIDDGAEVLGIDDLSSASPSHSRNLGDPSYDFIRGDVVTGLREEAWPTRFQTEMLAGIFHLACPASPVDYAARQIATLRTLCRDGSVFGPRDTPRM
jgi:dTDP-glucose 4,6-dehydratase